MKSLKHYLAKIFLVAILITMFSNINLNAECLTSCITDDGLNVRMVQSSSGWEMNIFEDDELVASYEGSGQYNGTICNGFTPCTVSEA